MRRIENTYSVLYLIDLTRLFFYDLPHSPVYFFSNMVLYCTKYFCLHLSPLSPSFPLSRSPSVRLCLLLNLPPPSLSHFVSLSLSQTHSLSLSSSPSLSHSHSLFVLNSRIYFHFCKCSKINFLLLPK